MKNISVWLDNIKLKKYPVLSENKCVDVLIIGGGITGISTLYHMKNSGLNVMLVEQNKISLSTTSRSTGKLTFLQNDLIDKIRTSSGDDIAKEYIKSQCEAINMIVKVVKKEKINCNLEMVNSTLYTNKENEINDIKDLKKFISSCNIKVWDVTNDLVKSKYMIDTSNTYVFHPVKFVTGLASN